MTMSFLAKRLCAVWTACLLAAGASCAAGQVVIREFMAANAGA